MAKGKPPKYRARSSQGEDSDFFHDLGAAWEFKEGEGLVVKLQTIPTNWDGTFILVPPKKD